jgi:hypothetical protein
LHNGGKAKLRASIRISDHSPEADFFGVVVVDFSEQDLSSSAAPRVIWQALKCHRDRGLPKVAVTKIEGELAIDNTSQAVLALPRQIGKLTPPDEIIVSNRALVPFGNSAQEWTIQGTTRQSRLLFRLRLKASQCALEPAE